MKVCARNEYFETIKPLLYALKIHGILPFVLNNKDTWHQWFLTLATNILSTMIYSIASGSSIFFVGNNIASLMRNFNFVHFVQITTEITLRIYVLIVPFAMWNKSHLFTQYYDQWKSIQSDIEAISGSSYKCSFKNTIRRIVYLILGLIVMITITFYFLGKMMSLSHRLSLILVASASNFTLGYWYGNCIFTRHVIQVILEHVQKTMNGEVDNEKLQKLADIWIHVCNLVDRFNSIHSIIFLAQTVLGVTNGISSFYSAILSFISHRKGSLIAGDLLPFLIGLSITYMYCESANTLCKQLVPHLQTIILNKNTANLPTNCLQTIRLFLNTIETRDPKIRLNGVVKIDRSTFVAMLAAGMNYLIILMQFGTLYEESRS